MHKSDADGTAASPQESILETSPDLRIRNRRKRYLDIHPEYFKQSYLELAGLLITRVT